MRAKKLPLRFLSHRYSPQATKWCTTEQEAYAIYKGVLGCQDLIRGHKLILRIDHQALVYMENSMNAKVMRWALALSTFRFEVEHIAGRSNFIADFLSRYWNSSKSSTAAAINSIELTSTTNQESEIPIHATTNDEEDNLQANLQLTNLTIDTDLIPIQASDGLSKQDKLDILQSVHNHQIGHHLVAGTHQKLKEKGYR